MKDDYTAPLGLDRPASKRGRLRVLPIAVGLLLLFVGTFAGWALIVRDPYGGQPHVVVDLPVLPSVLPAPAEAPAKPAPLAEPPDDGNGEIIIRDP